MKIDAFKVEQWMDLYETKAKYNLAETCIDSLTVKELLEIGGLDADDFLLGLKDIRLTYGHIHGSPEFTQGVAGFYENILPEEVIPTHGAIGANNMVIHTLIEPTDNMVSVMPTYQQHYSIPQSIGAEVRLLQLHLANDFLPDIEQLKALVDEKTKMITVNNPNNPTGSFIPKETMKQVIEVAQSVGAYVLCDEVYRGVSADGSYMYSVVDLYDKAISVGSLSKSFSLAGLRMGWIATKDKAVLKLCRERRDFDTISCAVLDDLLAGIALNNKEKIFERNRKIVLQNRKILDDFVTANPHLEYKRPVAGTTALVYYDLDMPSYELCVKLMEEKGVMFTPGSCFEMGNSIRIGYAFDAELLKEGLQLFAQFLEEHKG